MATSKLKEYESIAVFLIMELLALVSFTLGGNTVVFHYVGFVVAIIAFIFALNSFDKKENLQIIIVVSILVFFAGLIAFGNLYTDQKFFVKFGVFLAIPSFFLIGLAARRIKSTSIQNILLCIGFGTALLVLISLFITWAQYGLFYTLIYRDTPAYYYGGAIYDITQEMSWLNGFSVSEVTLRYAGIFAVLLCSALPALLFINPKEQTRKFVMVAIIGAIGILAVVTIINLRALLFLIPILLVALAYRFLRGKEKFWKVAKFIFDILIGFAAAVLVFAILNATVPAIHDITTNNAFFNRLFNANRIMQPFNDVMGVAFKPYNLFGFPTNSAADVMHLNSEIIYNNSHIFELEIIKEAGIFGLIAFLAFLVIMFFSFSRYLKRSKDSHAIKVVLLSFVVAFFLYCTFEWDNRPITHDPLLHPFGLSFPILIFLFITGLTYFPRMKEEPVFNQFERQTTTSKGNVEVEYLDQDYVFTDANTQADEDEDEEDDGKDSIIV